MSKTADNDLELVLYERYCEAFRQFVASHKEQLAGILYADQSLTIEDIQNEWVTECFLSVDEPENIFQEKLEELVNLHKNSIKHINVDTHTLDNI